jgi:hypothetical protein
VTSPASTAECRHGFPSFRHHPALVIAVIIVLHFVVYALAMQLTETLIAYEVVVPREPSPLIGLLQAWCSLTAMRWMQSNWSSPLKTLHAALALIAIWAILVMSGERTEFGSIRGAGWLASLLIQFLLTGAGVWFLTLATGRQSFLAGGRFTIMFLVLWTLVIGVILGASRRIIENFGWSWDALLRWQYFPHLIVVGTIGASQAIAIWAAIQSRWSWKARLAACGAIALATMIGANLVLVVAFRDAGAETLEICRQFGLQAQYLLVTLIPLQLAAEAAPSAERQTPPRPDSGR